MNKDNFDEFLGYIDFSESTKALWFSDTGPEQQVTSWLSDSELSERLILNVSREKSMCIGHINQTHS